MSQTKKVEFTVKFQENNEQKELKLAIVSPELKDLLAAQDLYNQVFANGVRNKSLLRPKLDDFLRSEGVWSEEKEAELTSAQEELRNSLQRMHKGRMKLWDDLRPLTIKIKQLRRELNRIQAPKDHYMQMTAESQAENMKLNFLVTACTVYNDTGKKYWNSVEELLTDNNAVVVQTAVSKYLASVMGLSDNPEADLPENKILIKYGLMDSNCRYLNREGKPVDIVEVDGQIKEILLDSEDRWVNEAGQLIDVKGRLLDENGDFVKEDVFFDDDGNVVNVEAPVEEEVLVSEK